MRTIQSAADFNEANIQGSEYVNAATLALPKMTGANDTIRIMYRLTGTGATVDVKLGTVTVSTFETSVSIFHEIVIIVRGASDALIFDDINTDMVEDTTNDYVANNVVLTVTGAVAGSVHLAYGV